MKRRRENIDKGGARVRRASERKEEGHTGESRAADREEINGQISSEGEAGGHLTSSRSAVSMEARRRDL